MDPSDLYDLLHLDQRADRVLLNGWCMLSPRQVCAKGNACLTWDKFVTDASHRDSLRHQLQQSEALIARRQTQFIARHGEPMGEDNIWLAGRLSETRALTKVLVALDQVSVHEDGQLRTVRGAARPTGPNRCPLLNQRSRPHDATARPPPAGHPRPEPGAEKRARTALAELVKAGKPVSFTAMAPPGQGKHRLPLRQPGTVGADQAAPRQGAGLSRHRPQMRRETPRPRLQSGRSALASLTAADPPREGARVAQGPRSGTGENLDLRRHLDRYEADSSR